LATITPVLAAMNQTVMAGTEGWAAGARLAVAAGSKVY
jgi:hypothetical protein